MRCACECFLCSFILLSFLLGSALTKEKGCELISRKARRIGLTVILADKVLLVHDHRMVLVHYPVHNFDMVELQVGGEARWIASLNAWIWKCGYTYLHIVRIGRQSCNLVLIFRQWLTGRRMQSYKQKGQLQARQAANSPSPYSHIPRFTACAFSSRSRSRNHLDLQLAGLTGWRRFIIS